jgi:putative hemolysin
MTPQTQQTEVFRLDWGSGFETPGLRRAARLGSSFVENALGLSRANRIYAECANELTSPQAIVHVALRWLRVRWKPKPADLARIPRSGPLVVVANHPFGAIEGLVLAATLMKVRDDVKVMANYLLGRINELRELCLFVDPFAGEGSAAANVAPLRQCIRHLRAGGVLAVFPAGEVASLNLRRRSITDPPWNETIARIIRKTGAPALPVHFEGRNSALFQALGLIHPVVRTTLLGREFFNKRGATIVPRVGSLIPFKRMDEFKTEQELTAYLRQRTFLLQHQTTSVTVPACIATQAEGAGHEPIIAPVDANLLAAEIAALPADQILIDDTDNLVCHARQEQIPHTMREIGRLREITFRATGEGAGKCCDIDPFDAHYLQLMLWNKSKRQLVGGYRLGLTDEILNTRGKAGLYTTTLFDCRIELLRHITPAIELGRSFVRAEYQRSFSPLMLLWKGVFQYIGRHPRYKYVFGAVSISNTYQSVSKQLMVAFLQAHYRLPILEDFVRARNPFRRERIAGWDRASISLLRNGADVSDLVADLEPQPKGIPVLLRQYLKLGARLLAFNVDPAFGNCIDALMVCDLSQTDTRILDRYLGRQGRERFLQYHADQRRPAQRLQEMIR